ncbi:lipase 1 [Camponotus floridanus]|uniref:lipase 1 n=1 Tax=Camponotus floridanus TaxID=104421 RepID=UPI000DC66908|nr:lipase 1 [Camponotus floridanus]
MLIRRIIWTNWNQFNIEFNPDSIHDTPEMIRKAGYLVESHVVMTEDGYLLTLHRIPSGNDSLPVLLQHGLSITSAVWLFLGKGKAFAYLLADQGYDVWLGNVRGNIYSKAHISLSPSTSTFWNFKSQPLHTSIGHSMGATSFFIMASERPKIAQMVQMMVGLAPAVFMNYMKSPIQYFFPFIRELKIPMQLLFHGEFLQSDIVRFLARNICNDNIIAKIIYFNLLFMLVGDDPKQFSYSLLPVILNHYPTSASVKTLLHYAQIFESGKFRKYDYGRMKNLFIYNSTEPPNYDLSNITVSVALFYDNNWIISTEDIKRLCHSLPNVVDMYEVPWSKFNHVDFILAKDASKLVYDRILKIMRRKNPNNITSVK